ncbi:MAG: hypothetical protein HGB12_13205 [Bacteroidetes bacterium]|nr:hypothetical protein [Bacteroidota bacterium]
MKKFIILFLIYSTLPFAVMSQDKKAPVEEQFAERPKYSPRKDKHLNVYDSKGKQGLWKFYSRDGILIFEVTFKNDTKHGTSSKYYYYSGLIREELEYYYGKRDGDCKLYFNNGLLSAEGSYKDNKKSGEWTTYYKSSGEKKSEGRYFENLKDSVWTYYNNRGEKTMQGKFSKGKKVGDWENYNVDGSVKSVTKYANGILVPKDVPETKKTTKPTIKSSTIKKTVTPANNNSTPDN